MAVHVDTHEEEHVSSIVGGILEDARRLFVDQLNLFKVEIKHDLQQTGLAVVPLILAAIVMVPASFLVSMGVAHGLTALFPQFPLWASFLLVGFLVVAVAVGLAFWGKSKLTNIRPVDTALKGLQENVQWKTKN